MLYAAALQRAGTRSGAEGAGMNTGCADVSNHCGALFDSIGAPARAQHADSRSIQPDT